VAGLRPVTTALGIALRSQSSTTAACPRLVPGAALAASEHRQGRSGRDGTGSGVEEASEPEPADHAAADPLGECGQVCGGGWPGQQERRRCVTPCMVSSRHEDAVGNARVEMHVVIERRAEAVAEGDAAGSHSHRVRPFMPGVYAFQAIRPGAVESGGVRS
jgi:hypothetical protein